MTLFRATNLAVSADLITSFILPGLSVAPFGLGTMLPICERGACFGGIDGSVRHGKCSIRKLVDIMSNCLVSRCGVHRRHCGTGRGRRKVSDTETVRQGNCSIISDVVRLGFVALLPCRTTSVSENLRRLLFDNPHTTRAFWLTVYHWTV